MPHRPGANRAALQLLDLPLLRRFLRKLVYPVEAYRFWETYSPGFSQPCRDLVMEDVSPLVKVALRQAVTQTLPPRRTRFLAKITGWPRIGYLHEVFPDAKFVHLYRDGRAVASSLLRVDWWSGWGGPARWRWGELAPEHRQRWDEHGQSFVALAAIQWEILMAAFRAARQQLPGDRLLEMRYEDMCRDPVNTLRSALDFCEMDWSPDFAALVDRTPFVNRNDQWRERLTASQQATLNECIGEALEAWGYA
jgi:hypothetical protein